MKTKLWWRIRKNGHTELSFNEGGRWLVFCVSVKKDKSVSLYLAFRFPFCEWHRRRLNYEHAKRIGRRPPRVES